MSKSIAHNEHPVNCGHPHVWTDDFMEDAAAGRKPLLLTNMDEVTRESREIALARSLPAPAVIEVLAGLFAVRGAPVYGRRDSGPEFVALAVKEWLKECGVQTHNIDPGSPWQNA